MLQFFRLNKYVIKSSENAHIWLPFVANMEFQVGELSEEHQKCNRNTHTQHTYDNTQIQKDSQLYKLFKKAHMSPEHLLLIFF